MFRKILLPTDGSRHAAEAARLAADLAPTHSGVIHPLVAVEYQYVTGGDLTPDTSAAIRERIETRARQALESANEIVHQSGAQTDGGSIVEGSSPEAILQTAREGEYDLVV